MIKNYNLRAENINKKIVLISDIHYYNNKISSKLNKVLKDIKKIQPEYICVAGDLIDEAIIYDLDCLLNWLKNLSNISKVIISLGNHDIRLNKPRKKYKNIELLDLISNLNNVFLLDNTDITFENITFIGLTNSLKYYENNDENIFLEELNKLKINIDNTYKILLCHSPITITKVKAKENKVLSQINLILSGHMHGGITPNFLRILFPNFGLISPNKKFFIKDAYGLIKKTGKEIIITSGITKASHSNPFKFLDKFFAYEIVVINII